MEQAQPQRQPHLHLCLAYDRPGVRRGADESVDVLASAATALVDVQAETPLKVRYEVVGVPERVETAAPSLESVLERARRDNWSRLSAAPAEAPGWRLLLDMAFREFERRYPLLTLTLLRSPTAESAEIAEQERWDALSRCAAATEALCGHLTYDFHPAPYARSWAWGSIRHLDERVPGYPWGLIVTERHLDALGGVAAWLEGTPAQHAELISEPPRRLMARAGLTRSPADLPEPRLRQWKEFLGPILARRQAGNPMGPPFLGLLPEDQPTPRGL